MKIHQLNVFTSRALKSVQSNFIKTDARRFSFRLNSSPLKDLSKETESKYFDFLRLEKEIYSKWENAGYFKPSEDKSKKSYVIPMPPPNVTGYLHMGHAMFVALQDLMARFQRMRGKATLWLPGTDHAGIATQLLVERSLTAKGINRRDIGREEFLKKVWEWKEEKGGYITGQMRRLGASADWSREKFTLEEKMSDSVTEAFIKLHEKGLIYKGEYMVNWSPNLQTAVSDLEVEYSEELGKLYHFKYELSDDSGFIPVATTRPETILGDSAVCVNPTDSRFSHLIGKTVKVPFSNPIRHIPIIGDEYVDVSFGTGALKVTPAHDVNDYELSKKHSLPLINIMNKDGSINENGGSYVGLDRFACREKLWKDMEEKGLKIKVEPHTQRVPRSQRGGEVIEPLVSSQWFCRMDNMAKRAVEAAKSGDIVFVPERFDKIWYNWLENIHDWCISRQLWWGHRIPVYYPIGKDGYIVARNFNEAKKIAVEKYGEDIELVQDEDVLDTWFSSGLWPFATVGWPNTDLTDYQRFYPAHMMETGYDILFFWVARMVMLGLEFTDEVPFKTIYLHGLVRDASGQKMSKTKGNVIDPLETIDKYGCDALRFALLSSSTPGQDIPLSMEKIESTRNFVNKLWNVGKYIENTLSSLTLDEKQSLAITNKLSDDEISNLPLAEQYIVSKCHILVKDVTYAMETYNYIEACRRLYEFLWDDFADWYIEASKTRMRNENADIARKVLVYVWDTALKLLHPSMPFVTETLWQILPHNGDSIMISDWPQLNDEILPTNEKSIKYFELLQSIVKSIRNARAQYNVEAGKKIATTIRITDIILLNQIKQERSIISLLSKLDDTKLIIELSDGSFDSSNNVHIIVDEGIDVYLPSSNLIDVEKELNRLKKQEEKLKKDISLLENRLISPGFIDKAPSNMVIEVKNNLQDKKEQLIKVENSMKSLVNT